MPEVCASCGISEAWICDDCWRDVLQIDRAACCRQCGHPDAKGDAFCPRCEGWPVDVVRVRSSFEFSGPLRKSVLRMKYGNEHARAAWHAAHLEALVRSEGWGNAHQIVPVPLHPSKLRKRGFNQSEKLAQHLGRLLSLPVEEPLARVRATVSQTDLPRDERFLNVAGAFECRVDLSGQHILLVDDVMTTGATLIACAQACRDAGATSVNAVTVATARSA